MISFHYTSLLASFFWSFTHSHTHTYTHALTYTHTHTYSHTHTHTHTYSHTLTVKGSHEEASMNEEIFKEASNPVVACCLGVSFINVL